MPTGDATNVVNMDQAKIQRRRTIWLFCDKSQRKLKPDELGTRQVGLRAGTPSPLTGKGLARQAALKILNPKN